MRTDYESVLDYIAKRVVTPWPDCRIWVNAVDRGYGRMEVDGETRRVHRVVWEAVNGPIPDGMTIDHLCRIRMCVNPEHMEVVSADENKRRATPFRATRKEGPRTASGRLRQPLPDVCANGHTFTQETTRHNARGARICLVCNPGCDTNAETCPKGHPRSEFGVIRSGRPKCRRCIADYMREYQQRQRAG